MTNTNLELYIIDAIGPFFSGYKSDAINWSKIPFDFLESEGHLKPHLIPRIKDRFRLFIHKVHQMGYNAISIDNLAHLTIYPFYPDSLKQKLFEYQELYRDLFDMAKKKKMRIYLNSDIMYFNPYIERYTWLRNHKIIELLQQAFENTFLTFSIDGIILRIGESDGVDVRGDFLSRLILKTPEQANRYMKALLPICRQYDKHLIFRNWTVGAYPIGDLMWNRKTYDETFDGLEGDHFFVSLKYGDTDFYSHLELAPLIKHGPHNKILELQTRREREGFGEFPFYVGWQYEHYASQLKDYDQLKGISVWCQTGGWCKWNNRTFQKNSSEWNELNTYATLKIFQENIPADEAIVRYTKKEALVGFLQYFNLIFQGLLYTNGMAQNPYYVRRLRIPPLMWIFWDHVTVSPLIISMHHLFGNERVRIREKDIKQLHKMGEQLKIKRIDFYCDTLRILLLARRTLDNPTGRRKLIHAAREYEARHPDGFNFHINLETPPNEVMRFLLSFIVRKCPPYRLRDMILQTRFFSYIFRIILFIFRRHMPPFINHQCMKVEVLFE